MLTGSVMVGLGPISLTLSDHRFKFKFKLIEFNKALSTTKAFTGASQTEQKEEEEKRN